MSEWPKFDQIQAFRLIRYKLQDNEIDEIKSPSGGVTDLWLSEIDRMSLPLVLIRIHKLPMVAPTLAKNTFK